MAGIVFNVLKGLTPKQKEIVRGIMTGSQKYTLLRSSRQAGKTHTLLHVAVAFSLEKKNQQGVFISPYHSQSLKVYDQLIRKIPKALIKGTSKSDAERYIELINGSRIYFKSAQNHDSIRGNSYDWIILDEASYIKEEAFTESIRPTINARRHARVVMASTPKGRNLFYKMCMLGQDPEDKRYREYYFTWRDNPFYDTDEVEAAKKELPELVFLQEYEGQFIFSNGAVFGDYSHAQKLKVWDRQLKAQQYFFGIDWSGNGADNTVLTIMDNMGKVALIQEINEPTLPEAARKIAGIINEYKALGYSEQNGLGLGATQILQTITTGTYKWITTNESKQQLVTDFKVALADNKISLPIADLCPKLDNEMAIFEVKRSPTGKLQYSHPRGNFHDDYVDSLLLANKARLSFGSGGVEFMSYDDIVEWVDIKDLNY